MPVEFVKVKTETGAEVLVPTTALLVTPELKPADTEGRKAAAEIKKGDK